MTVFSVVFMTDLTLTYPISSISVRTPSLWYLTNSVIFWTVILFLTLQEVLKNSIPWLGSGLIIASETKGLPFSFSISLMVGHIYSKGNYSVKHHIFIKYLSKQQESWRMKKKQKQLFLFALLLIRTEKFSTPASPADFYASLLNMDHVYYRQV